MRASTVPSSAPAWFRQWRERVVGAVVRAVSDLERSLPARRRSPLETSRAVQGVLFRLIGRAQAVERGLWRDDALLARLREDAARSAADRAVESLSALDADTRTHAPWSPGVPWLEEGEVCPIRAWPAQTAAALVDAVFSCEDSGAGVRAADLPIPEIGRLYEALLVLHDRCDRSPAQASSGRRKATGSYYTPDAIVRHITRRTLGCLITERAPEEILGLHVLDPAIGTGHFLLEALFTLSEAIAQAEKETGGTLTGSDPAPDVEPDVRRRWLVADGCLYGVDRDERAVALTRLLLWLAIGHVGPLPSGLLRHVQVGNSLVGCMVEDLAALPRAKRMIERGRRVRAELMRRRDGTPLPTDYEKVRASCDLRTSLWFEPPPTSTDLRSLFDRAERLARENQFLHWDLAFPEVFCDSEGGWRGNVGFDAIIGNPPYAAQIRPFRAAIETGRYTTTVRGGDRPASLNTAAIFIDRAHQLLRPGGAFGFIVPNSILRVGQYAQIRDLFVGQYTIHEVVDEGAQFEGANLETVSIIAQRRPPPPGHRVVVRDRRGNGNRTDGHVEQRTFRERGMFTIYLDDIVLAMERAPLRLGSVIRNQRGVSISPGNLLYLSRNPGRGRWMLRGRNLSRYALIHLPGEDRYLRAPLASPYANIAALFEEEKLLIQNIGSQIVAALSTEGEGFLETVNILHPLEGSELTRAALLVLLNSRLMSYYFSRALINRSPLTVHLDGIYTDRFPLPDCSRPLADKALARRIAERLDDPSMAEAPAVRLLDGIGRRLADYGRQCSATLARSTETLLQRIGWGTPEAALDLIRRNLWTAPTERFPDELRGYDHTGEPLDETKRRSTVRLHRRTRAELTRIGTEMGRPPFLYEGSWDALADAVVYRLYGMTEEQVGRVEDACRRSA